MSEPQCTTFEALFAGESVSARLLSVLVFSPDPGALAVHWDMRKYPTHDSFNQFMAELNRIYLTHPALSEQDYQENGFQWLDCHQEQRCIYAICRESKSERLGAIFNFSQSVQKDYTVTISDAEDIVPLLYSDWEPFGGHTPLTKSVCKLCGDELIGNEFNLCVIALDKTTKTA